MNLRGENCQELGLEGKGEAQSPEAQVRPLSPSSRFFVFPAQVKRRKEKAKQPQQASRREKKRDLGRTEGGGRSGGFLTCVP